ncbi:rieske 2Fe-2S family [Fusarium heterosporum]|uniref:Rieske 2Fe-2S family n=1 Tax=Fusarium heterosporum TaxID=42747 RepID=A0A8H5STP0_FUSHE|nr:rieske 2Fe-2S family [Fusarium heterosporum]
MSAAHLRQVDPQWSLDSAEYLSETLSALREQLSEIVTKAQTTTVTRQTVEQTLLGVIMLGMSTSWHGTSGLGLEHIQGSRALFQRYIYSTSNELTPSQWPKLSFYLGLQAYWESTASFVIDQDIDKLDTLHTACVSLPVEANYVNPWTGVSSTLWVLLAKVGCLVRKRRILLRKRQYSHSRDGTAELQIQILYQQAVTLEDQIITYTAPDISPFEATQDNQTIIAHLKLIAQCCRLSALLELYRASGSISSIGLDLGILLATDGVGRSGTAVDEEFTIFDGAHSHMSYSAREPRDKDMVRWTSGANLFKGA